MTCKLTTKTRRQGTAVSLCQMRYQPIRGKDIKNSTDKSSKYKPINVASFFVHVFG